MISRFAIAFALTTLSVSALSYASGEELLVLRNGYVISGEVSRVGDRYVVRVAEGSEARIPLSAVEFCCRNLEEAYQRKVSSLEPGQGNDRIKLIEWCLRHELVEHAEGQLIAAEQLDPLNPELHLLRRRFDSISQDGGASTTVSLSRKQPKADGLDRLIRGLPGNAVEEFTTIVQPLLVNRCSNGACHGPRTESTFRLIRPRPGRELERPFTQRNLHATLQTIDRDHPLSSPLAQALIKPHGPNDAVNAKLSKEQVERVVRWIKSLSKRGSAERPATIEATTQTLRQASPKRNRRPVGVRKDASPKPFGQGNNSAAKRDPFDPEVFNRRYHSKPESTDAPHRKQTAPRPRNPQTPADIRISSPRR